MKLFLVFVTIATIICFLGVLCSLGSIYREEHTRKSKFIITSALSIMIVLVSWFFNFGYLRLFMTALFIPFLHATVYFVLTIVTAEYITKSKKLKRISLLFCLTYLFGYLLLPDAVDLTMYVFFGLVKSNAVANVCNVLSLTFFIGNIVLFVLQIIELIKTKNKSVQHTNL